MSPLERMVRAAARGHDISDQAKAWVRAKDSSSAPKKPSIPSVEHHDAFRAEAELERERTSRGCWARVLERVWIDHHSATCCEACHRISPLEPHHLVLGAGGRPDKAHLVIALCADCHRLSPRSAHRAPRLFAEVVVIPWAAAHEFELPNRKEYRDAAR